MIVYLDTSALLKLYLLESGTEQVKALVLAADQAAISTVGYAEGRSGLARGGQSRRLAEAAYRSTVREFERQFNAMTLQDVTRDVSRLAGELAENHLLRGFDAIHLASAVVLQHELGEPVRFLAYDERLMAAAGLEGLTVS